jgi:hypothetical protein
MVFMKKTLDKLQKIGWLFFILGFLIPFPLVFLTKGEAISFILLAVFFGTAMLLLIGTTMFSAFSGHSKKVKNGPLVFGTVVSVKRTGLLVNHQPQLDIAMQFTTNDGQQITASDRRIISLTDLAQVQPGAMFPLRYNPENPEQIMIEKNADQAALQAAYNMQMVASGVTTQSMLDITQNGVRANGVVLSAQPTGNIINGYGEMTLQIKVTRPEYGGQFETTINKAIPQNMLAGVQPGSVIEVYYMPGNESKIAIGVKAS